MPDDRYFAARLPRAGVKDEIPEPSTRPGSLTGRERARLLNDPGEQETARRLQIEHHRRLEEADPAPRNG